MFGDDVGCELAQRLESLQRCARESLPAEGGEAHRLNAAVLFGQRRRRACRLRRVLRFKPRERLGFRGCWISIGPASVLIVQESHLGAINEETRVIY